MKNKKVLITIIVIGVILIIGLLFTLMRYEKPIKEDYTGEKFTLDDIYYHNGEYIELSKDEVLKLIDDKANFLLFTYNDYCSLPVPCDNIFQKTMDKYDIDVVKLPFTQLKETKLYDTVKLAPSIILIKDGEIVNYLKADRDEDYDRYQNAKAFESWLKSYVNLTKGEENEKTN